MAPRMRLGEMLLGAGVIDEAQLAAALGHQRKWGVRLGQALVELKIASEPEIVRALSAQLGIAMADLSAVDPRAQAEAAKLLPREFALRNHVLPLAADASRVTVATSDPTNLAVLDEIQFRAGRRVEVCIAGDRQIAEALRRCYPGGGKVESIALDLYAEPAPAGERVFEAFEGGGPAPASGAPETRDLTPRELAMLDALDRLASGEAPAGPEIVKPTRAMAAVIRLLIRKGIVTEEELLDELGKR